MHSPLNLMSQFDTGKSPKKNRATKTRKIRTPKNFSQASPTPFPFNAITIEHVVPELDHGKFAVKCVVGERLQVEADIFKEGHEVLGASLKYRLKDETLWQEVPMHEIGNDRWRGLLIPTQNSAYVYTIEAWSDILATWVRDMLKRCEAYPSVKEDLPQGLSYLKSMGDLTLRSSKEIEEIRSLQHFAKLLELSEGSSEEVMRLLSSDEFQMLIKKYPLKEKLMVYPLTLNLIVDRRRAEYAAWYEMFPRSQGTHPHQSGTFKDSIKRLPDIKKMGFNVIYLPPIHPIGRTNRKGPNNALKVGKHSPGSPWAIGGPEGGHKSIHPDLGSEKDFNDFIEAANDYGIEIAMDFAVQCSPDHPYVKEHPEWFYHQVDGSIQYAENPPKKYEDIYPLNLDGSNYQALWDELKSIVLYWIERGIKSFRVDNPHTKPLEFWRWLIEEIHSEHPEVIFLAEAFTRPAMMKYLAKTGFTQSYTYFTWRNSKEEIRQYFEELTQSEMKYYFRGNLFTNTPDILSEVLQVGGAPAFKMRLVLAATLSSLYGIYSGYELCEGRAVEKGSEEYLDSEKYQYKVWDWERPGNIKSFIARINLIRTQNPALHHYKNLQFFHSTNPHILCYGKKTQDQANILIMVVNLDPFHPQEDWIHLPIWEFGVSDWQTYQMKDLITGEKYDWKGQHHYVRLDPHYQPAHIFQLKK